MRPDVEEAFDLYNEAMVSNEEMLSEIHERPTSLEPVSQKKIAETYLGRKLNLWELVRLRLGR